MTKEDLKTADEAFPRSTTPVGVDRNARIICPEILAWAIAILAAAWTEWVFTAKSNPSSRYQTDPEYTNERPRQAAATNVKLVVPYIRCSIIDALCRAIQMENCKETNYEPDQAIDPANINLRKVCLNANNVLMQRLTKYIGSTCDYPWREKDFPLDR